MEKIILIQTASSIGIITMHIFQSVEVIIWLAQFFGGIISTIASLVIYRNWDKN